jgi:hypothetical protein
MIKYNNLKHPFILRMRSHKHIARVRIAVHETRDEDLVGECANEVIHDLFLVEPHLFELGVLRYFYAIDPLGDQHTFAGVFIIYVRNV